MIAQSSQPSRRIIHCCLNSALKERRITAYGLAHRSTQQQNSALKERRITAYGLAHRSEIATFMHAEGVREISGQKLK